MAFHCTEFRQVGKLLGVLVWSAQIPLGIPVKRTCDNLSVL